MIRDMREDDSVSVLSIYKEAIEEGESTFTVTLPPWPAFNNAHLPYLRFVYEEDGHVLGWIAVSRVIITMVTNITRTPITVLSSADIAMMATPTTRADTIITAREPVA